MTGAYGSEGRMSEALQVTHCFGKVGFATASSAHDAMRVMINRRKFRPENGCRLNVYRCRLCTAWHVGNTQD